MLWDVCINIVWGILMIFILVGIGVINKEKNYFLFIRYKFIVICG